MALSSDLISQFVKATNDRTKDTSATTHYGTIVEYNDAKYIRLDGSDLLTPIESTVYTKDGDRVIVSIKDHTATVNGNLSDPSASGGVVTQMGYKVTEFEVVLADKVSTKMLEAEIARIDSLTADNVTIKETLTANKAEIDKLVAADATITGTLTAQNAEIDKLNANKLDATIADIKYAKIDDLSATNISVYNLSAAYASLEQVVAKKLDAESADIKYANIDFTNIDIAAIERLYAKSGVIQDIVVEEGHITGKLVGVTIIGDMIDVGTLKADRLVVQGTDGIYYKLNVEAGEFKGGEAVPEDSLHGSIITAKSITAEKVNVSDLVAFDATIAGMQMTEGSIYSGVKTSPVNTTRGFYVDKNGQMGLGDADNYLRYYRDQNGVYRLEISANAIKLRSGGESKDIESFVKDTVDDVEIGTKNLIRNSKSLIFSDYYFSRSGATGEYNYLVDEEGNRLMDEDGCLIIG